MKYKCIRSIVALLALNLHSTVYASFEPELGNPQLVYTDGNYVDAISAMINYSVDDVSIGSGRHSLSHHIAVNSTNILNYGFTNLGTPRFWGYKDKYIGGIHRKLHTEAPVGSSARDFYVINVFDEVSTYEFVVDESKNSFVNIKDPKVRLTVDSNRKGYTLTRADGTQVLYGTKGNVSIPSSLSESYSAYGIMNKIIYPNNFTITIHRSDNNGIQSPIRSVTSNNGFQLKYIYQDDKRTIPSALKQKLSDAGYSNPESRALNLSTYMPKQIIALNNAVETCPLITNSCNTQALWPKVTYTWPVGAPYSMFVDDSEFKVTDMRGVVTTFKHYAHYYLAGFSFPRIEEINTNQGLKISYEYLVRYENEQAQYEAEKEKWMMSNNHYSWVDQSGKLIKSVGPAGTLTYGYEGSKLYNTSGPSPLVFNRGNSNGRKGVTKVIRMYTHEDNFYPNAYADNVSPILIESWDKEVEFEESFANKPTKVTDKLTGIITDYTYDQMGRVKSTDSDGLKKSFSYPYSYTGGCDVDPSYCNKPASVSNNYIYTSQRTYTSYSYHAASGNIESITYPKDSAGISPKIEFEYAQYTPRYINSSGNMSNGTSTIWLLKKMVKCENSALTDGECSEGDKISETYDYGAGDANNLFLIGKTVVGQRDGISKRYCFTYDRFGNVIGKTEPKANITCNTLRGF